MLDPDPYTEYGPGPRRRFEYEPTRIRINTGSCELTSWRDGDLFVGLLELLSPGRNRGLQNWTQPVQKMAYNHHEQNIQELVAGKLCRKRNITEL